MDATSLREHWQRIYAAHDEEDLSWFEVTPSISLDLLQPSSLNRDTSILDVGGGASRLVDALLDGGFTRLTVLDTAEMALEKSKLRLGDRAGRVHWMTADITEWEPDRNYGVWHDRAVFHFLTTERMRHAYRAAMEKAVSAGGIVVIGTFDLDGPQRCSGLSVQRYSAESLSVELGNAFRWTATRKMEHVTPAGHTQRFQFSRFIRV